MGKLSKRLVSIVTTLVVSAGIAFTSLPAVEAKAATSTIDLSGYGITYDGDIRKVLPEEETELPSASDYGLCDNVSDGVILHAFCWSFNTIKDNMKDIAEAGYTTIQTSPANACNDSHPQMKLFSDNDGTGGCWWWHYQPTDWTIGNYQLGGAQEYKAMCDEADKYGVKIITDVIPNHTTPDLGRVGQGLKDSAGGNLYHANGFNKIQDGGEWSWGNRLACTTGEMGGLPDVNTEDQGFQAYYLKYCNDLIALGCDGFRYDTAKHVGVPSDPKDPSNTRGVNDFWDVATGKKEVNGVKLSNPNVFIYGEVLQGDNVPTEEYARYMYQTASSFGGTLRGAVGSKNFSVGTISNWQHSNPGKIVTWVESHDTYCNNHESGGMTDWQIRMAWALITARKDGTPLFMSRPDGSNGSAGNYWGNNVLGAKGNDEFKAPEVVAVNKFRNAVVGEGETLRNPNGNSQILQIDRGTKGTVIINLGDSTTLNGPTTVKDGTYKDPVTGNEFTVSGGNISGKLEGGKVHVVYSAEPVKKTPKITATPSTSTFTTDTLNVSISVTNATNATYTTSEGDSGSISDSKSITIGAKTSVGSTITVNVKASNADGESTETYTYTKKEPLKLSKGGLYFTKPSSWSTPTAYVYDEGSGTAKEIKAWPGVSMSDEGDGVYFYQLPDEWQTATTQVIFTDGTNKAPDGALAPGHKYVVGTAMTCDGSTFSDEPIVTPPPVSNPTIGSTSVSPASSQKVGTTIKITAGSVSGGTAPYKYTIKAGSQTLASDSSSNYVNWTPSSAGTYSISVTVTDAAGKTASASNVSYVIEEDIIITDPLKIDTFKVTSPTSSSAAVGTSIGLSASASGGEGSIRYEFKADLDGNESVIKAYSTSTTCTWKPTKAGIYTLKVTAYDGATYKSKYISYTITAGAAPKLTSFATNVASPQKVNTAITLGASATGTGTIKYRFSVYQGTTLKAQSTASTAKTYVWKPTVAGTYTLKVEAQDSTGKVVNASKSYVITQAGPKLTSFATNVASPQAAGTAITLGASATGSGTIKYKFSVYQGTTLKAQSTASTAKTYKWKPTVAGTYTLKVEAQDSTGKVVSATKSYVIKNTLKLTSFATNVATPQYVGTSIKLAATAVGNGTIKYKFYVYAGSTLKAQSSVGTSNTFTWKPSVAGTYTIKVAATDSTNKIVSASKSYVIKQKEGVTINKLATSVASPQAAGTSIGITASAVTTTGTQLQYAFSVHNGLLGWQTIQKYSTNKTVYWKPTAAASYTIWLQVKDAKGNTAIQTMSYVVKDKITTIEQNNSKITYTGTWNTASGTSYSGGSAKYSSTAGAKASFKFTGTGIKLIGSKGVNRGYAVVTIDGKSSYVDFYNATALNKQTILNLTGLTNTTHTISIQVVGSSNLNATGNTIVIDAFEIINGTIA